MRNRLIGKVSDHMYQRIDLSEVGEKLRAKAIFCRLTRQNAGNIHELNGGISSLLGLIEPGQPILTTIRHRYDGHVRLSLSRSSVASYFSMPAADCVKNSSFAR